MAQPKYASFAAKDTREAGSLPSDFDAKIIAATFTKEPPNENYQADGNPIFAVVTYLIDQAGDYADRDEQQRTLVQSYGLGGKAGDEFEISPDGNGLIPTDTSVNSTRKGSKFDLWKCSLENEGVSQSITESGDISKFVGVYGHWRRVEDDKLLGKKREFGDDKKSKSKFPPQTLVCVKLLTGGAAKSAPAAGKTTTATAPAVNPTGDLDTQVGEYLVGALLKAPGRSIQRSLLIPALTKAAVTAKNRADIARRGTSEEFLTAVVQSGVIVGETFYGIAYDPASNPQTVSIKSEESLAAAA